MHLALKSAMSRIPYTNKVGETLGSIADSAAAYSLRALNGGDPMVARVRRSSDDAEKDFTASDVSGGALVDWVNEDIVHTMDNGTYAKHSGTGTISSATNTGFIIDSGASNLAVWSSELSPNFILNTSLGNTYRIECTVSGLDSNASVRIVNRADGSVLSTSYTISNGTNTILISTDLSTSSIYATIQFNGLNSTSGGSIQNITVTQIKADGHVTTWYDQSGNGNNATQSTAGSQPKIVDGGTLVSDGIEFDGANYLFRDSFTQGNLEQPNTILSVAKMDSNDDQNRKVYDGNPFTGRNMLFLSPEGSGQFGIYSGDTLLTGDTATSDKHLFTALYNSTSSEFFIDGTSEVSGDSGVYSMDAIVIGANHDKASNHWLGKIQEVIIYDSDQSSNRTAIETNINNYYDIY